MQVQRINSYPNYNPNFSAIKNVKYNGLFKKLSNCDKKYYKETIEKSLREFPEFIDYCNKHDVDIIFDTKVRDFIAPHMKGLDSGYNISIILKIVYERLWNTENGSVNEFLRKLFLNPIEQRVVIEQKFEQDGSRLSNEVINNFVKYINGKGRDSFVVKLRNADMEILKKTDPETYKEISEQMDSTYNKSLQVFYNKNIVNDNKPKLPLA